jgi:hypothetical protein
MPENTYKLTMTLTERQDAVLRYALDYLADNYGDHVVEATGATIECVLRTAVAVERCDYKRED